MATIYSTRHILHSLAAPLPRERPSPFSESTGEGKMGAPRVGNGSRRCFLALEHDRAHPLLACLALNICARPEVGRSLLRSG